MTSTQRRIAVLFNNFGPYHYARLNALWLRAPNCVGIELAQQELQREWLPSCQAQFEHRRLLLKCLEHASRREISAAVKNALKQVQPEVVVIPGYSGATTRPARLWAKASGTASILLCDSTEPDHRRIFLIELCKRHVIRRGYDSAFVSGARSEAYLKKLRFPAERIWRGYDVVDNQRFAEGIEDLRQPPESLGFPANVANFFLYVGRFAPEKNLTRLLEAYDLYRRICESQPWGLALVGSGPQEHELVHQVQFRNLQDVLFPGFQQLDELRRYNASAGALVLPSISEPWGLVVNEAMACGLPILASERCGCVSDLVFPGLNGYIFDPRRVDSMAAAMVKMAERADRPAMSEASRRIVSFYTPDTWARALVDCVETTCLS